LCEFAALFNLPLAVRGKIKRQEFVLDRDVLVSAAHKCLERND